MQQRRGGKIENYYAYGKIHDQIINTLKLAVFNEAKKDKFIARRAWNKAWKDLNVDSWGNAEDWTEKQMDQLLDESWKYLPKNELTNNNLIDTIKEVFGEVIDISYKLKEN